ncbi:MAG TPA: ABC transporter permease subunit [Acidobacteriaceae bacterium]|jgi:peptide/nickel transport system permease protein
MRVARTILIRLLRVVSLVLLAALGTIVLMRVAPGYFTDSREMDGQYASAGRAAVQERQAEEGTLAASLAVSVRGWSHGSLGQSRQYDVPVTQLLRERAAASSKLLLGGVAAGWLLSLALTLLLSARRTRAGEPLIALSTAVLLALPVGALATFCLLSEFGGPMFVLALLIAVRDFKLLYRMLRQALRAPQVLYARAQGFSYARILRVHLLRTLGAELLSLAMMSFAVALSALVPVEVIFDVPGLGQLAWNAAMNRDLPVLVAVTLVMAACVGVASLFAEAGVTQETAQCA